MEILLTGASGMLGKYLQKAFEGDGVITLHRHEASINCDLSKEIPYLGDKTFDLVVHAAGTCEEAHALAVNLDGTRNLLAALDSNPPKEIVFISSWEVYSPDSGENVTEDHQLWASSKVGQSKALAEKAVTEWCNRHDVLLTIVRPARMFGKGIKGEMATMYNDVINARYIHVRDNNARLSLVCAADVAEAIERLHSIGGIYNITDGEDTTWIELADAMSANSGQCKRQTFLPEKWALVAWKFMPWIPAVKASLNPDTLARRSKTLTLSDEKLKTTLAVWHPFPTIDVISRKNKDYPYEDD